MDTMATTYTTQLHHFELDLSAACYPNSISGRLNDVVPVLKTSTGKEDQCFYSSPLPHCPSPFPCCRVLSCCEGTGSTARGLCIAWRPRRRGITAFPSRTSRPISCALAPTSARKLGHASSVFGPASGTFHFVHIPSRRACLPAYPVLFQLLKACLATTGDSRLGPAASRATRSKPSHLTIFHLPVSV